MHIGSGGEYDGDRKMDDLKLLYRAYVTDALSGGRMEEEKVHITIPYKIISKQWTTNLYNMISACLWKREKSPRIEKMKTE